MQPKKKVPKIIILSLLSHFTLSNKVKEDEKLKEELSEHYEYKCLEEILDIVLTYSNINVFTLKVGELKKIKEFNPYWRRPIK